MTLENTLGPDALLRYRRGLASEAERRQVASLAEGDPCLADLRSLELLPLEMTLAATEREELAAFHPAAEHARQCLQLESQLAELARAAAPPLAALEHLEQCVYCRTSLLQAKQASDHRLRDELADVLTAEPLRQARRQMLQVALWDASPEAITGEPVRIVSRSGRPTASGHALRRQQLDAAVSMDGGPQDWAWEYPLSDAATLTVRLRKEERWILQCSIHGTLATGEADRAQLEPLGGLPLADLPLREFLEQAWTLEPGQWTLTLTGAPVTGAPVTGVPVTGVPVTGAPVKRVIPLQIEQ